jgi:hypothetical protein
MMRVEGKMMRVEGPRRARTRGKRKVRGREGEGFGPF